MTNNKKTIGLLISLCSRNQNYKLLSQADIFRWLLPSLFETWEPDKFNYKLFIGYDDDDEFFIRNAHLLKLRLAKISTFTMLEGCKGNPCEAWNQLLTKNIDNADYFYQIGSDIRLSSKGWSSYFVNILTKNNNIGMCGGIDKGYWAERMFANQNGIIENGFFHKTHFKIFNTLFNSNFKTWYSDDYLARIYGLNNCCFVCSNILFQNINRVGQKGLADRYTADMDISDKWLDIANQDAKKIFVFIQNLIQN
jgi:hypothetical protein